MKVVLIVLLFLTLAGWDVPQLIGKRQRKVLLVYSLLMAAGLVLSILTALRVHLPSFS